MGYPRPAHLTIQYNEVIQMMKLEARLMQLQSCVLPETSYVTSIKLLPFRFRVFPP